MLKPKIKVITFNNEGLIENERHFYSLVTASLYAYGFDNVALCTPAVPFYFHISHFTQNGDSDCVYDAFFAAWVSIFLTRKQRDNLIKSIRSGKYVFKC